MQPTVKLEGAKELQRYLKKMSVEHTRKVKQEVYASGLDVQKDAKSRLKISHTWDTGNLANTIIVDRIDNGLSVEVGPTAPYGVYVEHGSKPHFPPLDALEDWAKRHGLDSAWPICLAISKRGLPAKPYLLPAYLAVVGKFVNRLRRIFNG